MNKKIPVLFTKELLPIKGLQYIIIIYPKGYVK